MDSGKDFVSRRLKLLISPELARGVTVDLHSPLTFKATLEVTNIDKCALIVTSDKHVFRDYSQEIEVEFTSPIAERDADIKLTPVTQSVEQIGVSIIAKAGTLRQASGFFVTIVE